MIEGLWKEVKNVWDEGILGTNLGDIFFALGIFLLFLLARKLFIHTTIKSLQLMVQKPRLILMIKSLRPSNNH